jgi:hypothetical protein
MMFNHDSKAVEARWMGLTATGDSLSEETLGLDDVIARVGLSQPLVNSGQEPKHAAALQRMVPLVVDEARKRVTRGRKEHVRTELAKRISKETRRLEAWVERSTALIQVEEDAWTTRERRIPKHVQDRIERARQHLRNVEQNHAALLKSVQAIGEPYVRIVAVFAGD